jgi:hypothetical protein
MYGFGLAIDGYHDDGMDNIHADDWSEMDVGNGKKGGSLKQLAKGIEPIQPLS